MNTIDYVTLGFKNLSRRKSRSFLTILAVVIGAISVIIMLSLVLGAKQIATQQLESIDGLTLISVSANPEMEASGNLLSSDSGSDTERKLNDSDITRLRNLPNVIDATPLVGVWIKSIKLEGQDKKFRANLMAYDVNSKVLNIPASAGRSLRADDMDKIVIGTELLRNFGFVGDPEGVIGKKVILYTEGGYTDWEADPPKPSTGKDKGGDDKAYWDNLQKSREITAEIVGVVTNGPDQGQNYITLGWARKLMTFKEWGWDNAKQKRMEDARQFIEQQLQAEQESQKQVLYAQLGENPTDDQRKMLEDSFKNSWETEMTARLANLGYTETNLQILVKRDELANKGYGSILLRVDNTDNIDKVGESVRKLGYGAQTAKEMLAQIEKIFGLIGLIIGAIGGIVLFVAAIGIINTMIMATYERTREIGIMRACGATRRDIRNLFIFEAGILGFLGGVIGLIISYGLAKIGNMIGNQIALSQSVPINNLISFPPWLIISVITLTTLIGIIAGLLPAIRASHLDPVEALRFE